MEAGIIALIVVLSVATVILGLVSLVRRIKHVRKIIDLQREEMYNEQEYLPDIREETWLDLFLSKFV